MDSLRNDRLSRESYASAIALDLDEAASRGVSPDLYGCNLEHTRSDIYSGLSAQMIRNRKFVGKPTACCGCAAEWFPIGERTVFQFCPPYTRHADMYHMHRAHECNGLNWFNPYPHHTAGIGQHELHLTGGWVYDFALVVKTDKPLDIMVSLTDRGGKVNYASDVIRADAREWERYTLKLKAPVTDADADLRISVTDAGSIYVGAVSMMPEDNFRGMRKDVVERFKELGVTILRWPGGNFAGEYSWFDGLLPVDMRAPFESYQGIETQPHSMGYDFHEMNTDDFVALCREVGAQPFITINPSWNTPEENAAWVEYCNGDSSTKYGRMRAERGFEEPYNVRLWSLGNEAGYGHMEGDNTPVGYCRNVMEQGRKMLEVDPALKLCSSGPNPNEAWAKEATIPLGVIAKAVSLHHYGNQPMYFQQNVVEEEYYRCLSSVEYMRDLCERHRALLTDELEISFDEWNVWYAWYRPSSVTDGIYNALALHMLIQEAEKRGITMACHFEAVNEGMIRVYPDRSELTAQGQVFSRLKSHAGGKLVYSAADAIATKNGDGVVTVSVVNGSLDQCKDVDLSRCGECVEASLYSSDTVLPPSRFQVTDVLETVRSGKFCLPPHSLLVCTCQ